MDMIDKFDGDYAFLSNFYEAPCKFEGEVYPTVEHAFQAAKTLDLDERKRIAKAETPGQAKRMGRNVSLRADWEDIKTDVMRECLISKFSHPVLKMQLLATDEEELIEGNYWHDTCWGICSCEKCNGKGENRLGKILMEVRTLYRGY
jgi:ribA/ribD-fused uncharacterized protein